MSGTETTTTTISAPHSLKSVISSIPGIASYSEKSCDVYCAPAPTSPPEYKSSTNMSILLLQILGAFAAAGAGTARPLMTVIFGGLVNTYNGGSAHLKHTINKEVLYLLYVFIGQWILICVYGILFSISAMRHTMKLRAAYLRSTICQDVEQVSESRAAVDLSTNITLIEDARSEKLGTFVQAISTVITSLAISFSRSWRLTLLMLTTVLVLMSNNMGMATIDAKLERSVHEVDMQASALAEESFSGIRAITACLANTKLCQRYAAIIENARIKDLRKAPVASIQFGIHYFVILSSYALGFWYGTKLLKRGEIASGSSITIIVLCTNQVANALELLLPIYGVLSKAKAAHGSLRSIIESNARLDPFLNDGLSLDAIYSRIEFQGVDFAYPSRPTVNVLDGMDLVFGAGKTTAVVGSSGSGKSTIVNLIERWYDPTGGNIFINAQSIDSYNIKSLRSNIRVVHQDTVLFNDSVYHNVAHGLIGSPFNDLSEVEKRRLVIKVCREVQAHDFIESLPQGYDTIVGNRGSLLSGGQRQRIAICRAMISNPVILIFDEATSALDRDSERKVQAAIERVSRGRTTIIIAHNLATVRSADRIILLEDGKVSEEGTHESLLRTSDAYARTWKAQNLSTEDQAPRNKQSERVCDDPEIQYSESAHSPQTLMSNNITDTNSALALDLTTQRTGSIHQTVKSVLKSSRGLQYILIASVIVCVVAGLVYPSQSIIIAETLTSFQKHGAALVHSINFWSLRFLLVAIGAGLAFFAVGTLSSIGGTITARNYRGRYFQALMNQPMTFFDTNAHTPGLLVACLSGHPSDIQKFVATVNRLMITIVNLSSTSLLAIVVSWKFALVALFGSLPIIVLAGFLRVRGQSQKNKNITGPLMDSAQYAAEVIANIRTVSAFAMEEEVCRVMDLKMKRSLRQFYRSTITSVPFFAFSHSGYLLGMTLGFWYSGHLLAQKNINSLQLWIVFLAVNSGAEAASEFFASADSILKARSSSHNIARAELDASEPVRNDDYTMEKPMSGTVTFQRVSFSYNTAPAILKDISFHVEQGQKVAIVGPSGSGKSTIINLLERFYKVNGGEIRISGASISTIDLARYRSKVSLVSQETELFEGTIRDNILLGVPPDEEDEAGLIKAAQDAHIHDFIISLPEGYNTACGKKGVKFSGGQRQRIAIARALVRNPTILLLDEATSALDSKSESEVKKTLSSASEGRTTVAVAHRLSTIQDADEILVLVKGEIVERGNHDELTDLKGVYWRMCQKQNVD